MQMYTGRRIQKILQPQYAIYLIPTYGQQLAITEAVARLNKSKAHLNKIYIPLLALFFI